MLCLLMTRDEVLNGPLYSEDTCFLKGSAVLVGSSAVKCVCPDTELYLTSPRSPCPSYALPPSLLFSLSPSPPGSIACLWWDPIQRLLFSGASDNSIIMWDIGGRKGRTLLLQGHQCVTVLGVGREPKLGENGKHWCFKSGHLIGQTRSTFNCFSHSPECLVFCSQKGNEEHRVSSSLVQRALPRCLSPHHPVEIGCSGLEPRRGLRPGKSVCNVILSHSPIGRLTHFLKL